MNRNGISSLGDNGICIPLSTSSYDCSESERYDEQYNEKQEEQSADDASNAYTYRAKEINWRTSAKDEKNSM